MVLRDLEINNISGTGFLVIFKAWLKTHSKQAIGGTDALVDSWMSRHSHDKTQGRRIASYLTDEQRSHAGWIGASQLQVTFARSQIPKILK
ncbi:MAG: hypothetical protein LWW98_08690 [Deltaproteobacteria bacterium]|nr:hypothetical protein [Deltaproteobacteria bacterium]